MTLYLDIETVEDLAVLDDEDLRVSLVRDHGDPDAADRDTLDRLALSPMTGTIAVCSFWDTDKGGFCLAVVDDEEHDIAPGWRLIPCDSEADLVRRAWKGISARRQLATWNGDEFDLPFLVTRAAVHGVPVPLWVVDAKPWEDRVVDVCRQLAGPDRYSRRSLECACRAFGVASPKSRMSGAEVGEAWAAGRRLAVAAYCCDDVRALAMIGDRYLRSLGAAPARMLPTAPASDEAPLPDLAITLAEVEKRALIGEVTE